MRVYHHDKKEYCVLDKYIEKSIENFHLTIIIILIENPTSQSIYFSLYLFIYSSILNLRF